MKNITISLVILTYKRKELVLSLIEGIAKLKVYLEEIIIVDNNSEEQLEESLSLAYPQIKVLSLNNNVGTEGRNLGIASSTSDIVILLDDDVFGLTEEHVETIRQRFSRDEMLAALCFKVVHAETGTVINWCHHKPKELFADNTFETYEITEGAVAVRRSPFLNVGGFPGHFFISHEGPDLALRIIDSGLSVCYDPGIVVLHHQSTLGRASWRRYYFDTRNVIWMSVRNYPFLLASKFLIVQLGAMFVYSVRDGFIKYYFKAIFDAIRYIRPEFKARKVISSVTVRKLKELNIDDEGFWRKAKKRFLNRDVAI
jgi:GT2 family glycosyltransferase